MEQATVYSLPDLPPSLYFRLANGQIIKSLAELPELLDSIDPKIFSIHVTSYSNDFARWIYDVYRLPDLSSIIGSVKSREEMIRIIKAYLLEKGQRLGAYNGGMRAIVTEPPKISPGMPIISPELPVPENSNPKTRIPEISKVPAVEQNAGPDAMPAARKLPDVSAEPVTMREQTQEIPKQVPASSSVIIEEIPKQEPPRQEPPRQEPPRQEPQKQESQNLPGEMPQVVSDISDPDKYFQKNPVIIENYLEAKQSTLSFSPLSPVDYEDDDPQLANLFKDTYSKAYQRIVLLRKSGYDMSLPELMLFRIPSKIKIFEASREHKDSILVKRYLNEVIEEINNVKKR